MTDGGFVVSGTRPPSALSNYQSHSTQYKHSYHILARKSAVDELLFHSHRPARLNEPIVNFKAPWEYPKPQPPCQTFRTMKNNVEKKSKPQERPLLWCPAPGSAIYSREKMKSSLDDTGCLWSTRDHFRQLRHTPSFVDESLFGQRLEEPSFEAPWNFKKKWENKKSLSITNQNETLVHSTKPSGFELVSLNQPSTTLSISTGKNKLSSAATVSKPVWRP